MTRRLTRSDLLFVGKSHANHIKTLKAGQSLAVRTGYSLDEILVRATKDRVALARRLGSLAARMLTLRPPMYRMAVSTSYYAMYHAFRALVFFMKEGDDHEKHTLLPDHIPDDFPDSDNWQNKLKNARFERNKADYDPYPESDTSFEGAARQLVDSAQELIPAIRRYLRSKGCAL